MAHYYQTFMLPAKHVDGNGMIDDLGLPGRLQGPATFLLMVARLSSGIKRQFLLHLLILPPLTGHVPPAIASKKVYRKISRIYPFPKA